MVKLTLLTWGCPSSMHLFGVNPKTHDYKIWHEKTADMIHVKHFDILNHLGMAQQCNRQTDGQNDTFCTLC